MSAVPDSTKIKAHCDRRGVISFGAALPEGSLPIATADEQQLREAISGLARLAYDGKTLLVPCIPEADSEGAALDALIRFELRVRRALARANADDERCPVTGFDCLSCDGKCRLAKSGGRS